MRVCVYKRVLFSAFRSFTDFDIYVHWMINSFKKAWRITFINPNSPNSRSWAFFFLAGEDAKYWGRYTDEKHNPIVGGRVCSFSLIRYCWINFPLVSPLCMGNRCRPDSIHRDDLILSASNAQTEPKISGRSCSGFKKKKKIMVNR